MVSLGTIALQLHKFAGYASVSAIESPCQEDDTQWLTYWVLYSFFQLVELGFERILYWIPFWYSIKLVGFCWLVLPQFHGAAFIYENYAKKYFGGLSAGRNEELSSKQRQLIQQMSAQAQASVSAFISEYGSGAFDSFVATITVEAKRSIKSPTFANRYRASPVAAQPCRYPTLPLGPSSCKGSSHAAEPTEYTGSPPFPEPIEYTRSPASRVLDGVSRSDSFREYCRQPVKLLKTSLHSLENRRNEIRAKMRTNFVS